MSREKELHGEKRFIATRVEVDNADDFAHVCALNHQTQAQRLRQLLRADIKEHRRQITARKRRLKRISNNDDV